MPSWGNPHLLTGVRRSAQQGRYLLLGERTKATDNGEYQYEARRGPGRSRANAVVAQWKSVREGPMSEVRFLSTALDV